MYNLLKKMKTIYAFNLVPKNIFFDVIVYIVLHVFVFFIFCMNVIFTVLGNVKYYFLHVNFEGLQILKYF